ncbi:ABC transporter permease [Paenibacillus senegalensis]|uniref:ABC transporter permease n=1 Tax=Paenibacillus senegalensis TaxID=1465766 RepID=UPI0002892BFF|nr:FtsX-like permease family protein [Paenibacillus senegalensis]
MRDLWLISWRNVTRNRKRFLLTLIAIALGVSLTCGMLIVKETTERTFEFHERLYTGGADFWVLSHEHTFPADDIAMIMEDNQVQNSLSVLDKQGFVELEGVTGPALTSVRLSGVSRLDHELLVLELLEGDLSRDGLVLPEDAARLWNKRVGDTVVFRDMGSIEVTAIVGYTPILRSPSDWEEAERRHFRVMLPLATLQDWTNREEQISYLRFQVNPQADKNELLARYEQQLAGSAQYVQPVVIDDRQNNSGMDGLYFTLYTVAIVALFISGFIVFNMIFASVMERRKEFSIMKSLGYTNIHIYRLVLMEVLLLSLLGILIGIPLGVWFGDLFQYMLLGIFEPRLDYILHWQAPSLISMAIGVLFPVAASCIPMYIAGNTPILQAMRNIAGSPTKKTKHLRWIIGLLLLGGLLIGHSISLLFLFVGTVLLYPYLFTMIKKLLAPLYRQTLGYPGEVAVQNMERNLNRNANTSAMLACGIALVLFLGASVQSLPEGYEQEISATFGGDLRVHSESPWEPEAIERIAQFSGVAAVHPYRVAPEVAWQTKDGDMRRFPLISFDPEAGEPFQLFSVRTEDSSAAAWSQPGSILLGEWAYLEWGGRIGDSIHLHTPKGLTAFEVAGIVQTSHHDGYVAFMDVSLFTEQVNWPHAYHLLIDSESNDQLPGIRDQLWQHYGDRLSSITSMQEAVASAQRGFDGINELMQGLLILVICLSSIGIGNTLLMNTIERISEIGTIRATGFTKGQVKLMILGEGSMIGMVGIAVGSLLGLGLIYYISISEMAGSYMFFTIPWANLGLAVCAGIALSLFASWLPASVAVKVNVHEALKYE